MSDYRKPLPQPSVFSRPFWDAAKRGELVFQYCTQCSHVQHPPRPLCQSCWSDALAWKADAGRGTVYTLTVVHRSTTRGFRDDTPYIVAIVELANGVRMTSNIVRCKPDEVRIGMAVEVLFDAVTADCTLPKFAPAGA